MSNIDTSTWKEFSLDELFEISTTKSQNKNAITFDDNGIYDFIGRSSVNYGIQGHLNRQEYEPNPAKVFSLVQVGESVCLYRENEWYASQNIYMLKPKDKRICAAHNFFETLINKQLLIYTSAYIYPCLEDIKKIKILLPRKETEDIDFDFMEKYIHAIEKQTIARVYEGRGKTIKKTKEIVSEKTM